MKRVEPPVGEEAVPFWDATREGRLVLPWCTACEQPFWYPRVVCPVCPVCLGDGVEWREAGGEGSRCPTGASCRCSSR